MKMPTFNFVTKRIETCKQKTVDGVHSAWESLFKAGMLAIVVATFVWIAIFLYVSFYYAYMPSMSHVRQVHFQFTSCEEERGMCSFPAAHVQLTKMQQVLMIGQQYKIYINLDMPESPTNKHLGMFMVCARLVDKDGILVSQSCRSTMLHYRSHLLHTLTTFAFSPLLIFGGSEEKQTVTLELYSNFEEDQDHPVTDIYVEVRSRHVEFYSAVMHVQAHLTGLRYLMFNWPVLSAAVGIGTNLFVMIFICSLSWRLYGTNADYGQVYILHRLRRSLQNPEGLFTFKGQSEESDDEGESVSSSGMKSSSRPTEPHRPMLSELPQSESFQLIAAEQD